MIYLNAIWNKWGEVAFHKNLWQFCHFLSRKEHIRKKCMKMISQRKTLKRFLKKIKKEKYISKKSKNENLFGFILRQDLWCKYSKNKDILLNSLWFCVNFVFNVRKIHWNIVTTTLSLDKDAKAIFKFFIIYLKIRFWN